MKVQKTITLFLLAIMFQSCQSNQSKSIAYNSSDFLQMFELSIKCQNEVFPSKEKPVCNGLIIFFNEKNCPSCLVDLKNYIDVMNRNYNVDAKFYTNKSNVKLNGIGKIIPMINLATVEKEISDLEYPLLFETDSGGRIINCMPVNSAYLYISLDYIKKYAHSHPKGIK
jgi:hypothetical protein